MRMEILILNIFLSNWITFCSTEIDRLEHLCIPDFDFPPEEAAVAVTQLVEINLISEEK